MTLNEILTVSALVGGAVAGWLCFLLYYVCTEPYRKRDRRYKKGYNQGYDDGYTDGFNAYKSAEDDRMAKEISDMWEQYEKEHKTL